MSKKDNSKQCRIELRVDPDFKALVKSVVDELESDVSKVMRAAFLEFVAKLEMQASGLHTGSSPSAWMAREAARQAAIAAENGPDDRW